MIDENTVAAFIAEHGLACGVEARYIDLVSEVGELGKELLRATDWHRGPFRGSPGAGEELGDCLFALIALAGEMGLNPAAALGSALAKYRARLARTGDIGSGR